MERFEDIPSDELERQVQALLNQLTDLVKTMLPLSTELHNTSLPPQYRIELYETLIDLHAQHQQLHERFMRMHDELQRRPFF